MTTASISNYSALALRWRPERKSDSDFTLLAIAFLVVFIGFGFLLSLINLPEEPRVVKTVVPERVAQFILEREKPKPPPPVIEQPKPKPLPKPKPIERETIKRDKPKEPEKPLTKKQEADREVAKSSGLLALGDELADLIDTSEIDDLVGGSLTADDASTRQVARLNSDVLTAGASQGSGGVQEGKYIAGVTGKATNLTPRQLREVRQGLVSKGAGSKKAGSSGSTSTALRSRAEEDITVVFDQNKSKLYSVYNRERRKNPGLKGKIVLEITIAPNGKVTNVKILSSQLNNPALERRLIARIKQFNFGVSSGEPVTVTYPIEFLPS